MNPWLIHHRNNKPLARTPIKEGTNEPSESPSPAVLIFRENADIRIRKVKGDNQLLTESACEISDSYAFKEVPLKALFHKQDDSMPVSEDREIGWDSDRVPSISSAEDEIAQRLPREQSVVVHSATEDKAV